MLNVCFNFWNMLHFCFPVFHVGIMPHTSGITTFTIHFGKSRWYKKKLVEYVKQIVVKYHTDLIETDSR